MDQLWAVLEASPEAVLVVDADGTIQYANRNVPGLLGYQPKELEGSSVETLLLEADREDHIQYRNTYFKDPEPRPMGRDLNLYALHQNGTEIPVEIGLGPIGEKSEVQIVATITDLSEVKLRERELKRQNGRLEAFTSVVSHDLRNPLNVALGRLELAKETVDMEHLEAIEMSLRRMETLIEDLLKLARHGESVGERELADLTDVVEICWANVETADAVLTVESERTIDADPSRLRQVFENLFRNAIEHGGEDVTVTVGALHNGFYCEDDGPGIPDGKREEVFRAGYSTNAGGTGFGLSIVKEIVEAHGWEITVTEGTEGGARFEVTMPTTR